MMRLKTVSSPGGKKSEDVCVRGVVIGLTSEKEGESDPKTGKTCAGCDIDDGHLYHKWLSYRILCHRKKDLEVGQVTIFGWIVGKHQTTRQVVKLPMTPAKTRAIRMPNMRPESTTDNADALRSGGARSAARGIKIWGVTVTTPIKKDKASKTRTFVVTAKPIVRVVDVATSSNTSCLRRTRSPRGDIRSNPTKYLDRDNKSCYRKLISLFTLLERGWGYLLTESRLLLAQIC